VALPAERFGPAGFATRALLKRTNRPTQWRLEYRSYVNVMKDARPEQVCTTYGT